MTPRRPKRIPAAERAKPAPRRPASSEHDEQAKVIAWARLNSFRIWELGFMFAIPNGAKLPARTVNGRRICTEATRLKAEGLLPGVSDLFLPAPRGPFCGLFLEMKYDEGETRPEQDRFLQAMIRAGYDVEVCWTAQAAIERIQKYLAQPAHKGLDNHATIEPAGRTSQQQQISL